MTTPVGGCHIGVGGLKASPHRLKKKKKNLSGAAPAKIEGYHNLGQNQFEVGVNMRLKRKIKMSKISPFLRLEHTDTPRMRRV